MKYKSFRDLKVWQLSSSLSRDISTILVPSFPKKELVRLGDQIIRSSRSVPSQIAEGFRKNSLKEKNRYYSIAATSNDETENHLTEAKNNTYVSDDIYRLYFNRVVAIRILLSKLMQSIRNMDRKNIVKALNHSRRES
jgi:four helix bundle protein